MMSYIQLDSLKIILDNHFKIKLVACQKTMKIPIGNIVLLLF